MKIKARMGLVALATIAMLSPVFVAVATPASAVQSSTTSVAELSGASGYGVVDGQFGIWRGRPVDIAGTWSDDDANSSNFWQLKPGGEYAGWNKPLDIAVGAIDASESWQAAATGAYDARWAASLTKLKALRSSTSATTYIRFAHEMNGNWYPWSVNAANYGAFDAAWERYRALQKSIFPTAKLVFCVNRDSVGANMDWRKFFPGKEYVDVIGVDSYDQWPYIASDAAWSASLDDVDSYGAPQGLDGFVKFAGAEGVPLAIPEWSGMASFGDSAPFVTDMLSYVSAHAGQGAGQISYDILFNSNNYNGNFEFYGPNSKMPESSAAYKAHFVGAETAVPAVSSANAAVSSVAANSTLQPGSSLTSSNGKYKFAFQTDGNLVIYNGLGKAIWSAHTEKKRGVRLALQVDANLVLYDSSRRPLWNTKTNGRGAGAILIMQSDGNLVIYSKAKKPVWNSNTRGR